MAPFIESENCHSPSRTEKYKKVLKPLLERRRRARINSCLDELKSLLSEVSELDGDSSRLEKADILELAVTHLRRLKHAKLASVQRQQQQHQTIPSSPAADMTRYRAGFSAAATVVSRALASVPGVDVQLGSRVMQQLGHAYQQLDERRLSAPLSVQVPRFITRVPATSCVSPAESCSSGYSSSAESGLLTVARDSQMTTVAEFQQHSRSSSAAFTPEPRSTATPESHCQTSPLNLVAGEEDMWRPW